MARKRHPAEEIVAKLRQVDVLIAQGRQVCPSSDGLRLVRLIAKGGSSSSGVRV